MDPRALADTVARIAARHLTAGAVESVPTGAEVALERPRNRDHGDWSTSVAMKFAKALNLNPREFAETLASELRLEEGVHSAEVAGPGFINITLDAGAAGELVVTHPRSGERLRHQCRA